MLLVILLSLSVDVGSRTGNHYCTVSVKSPYPPPTLPGIGGFFTWSSRCRTRAVTAATNLDSHPHGVSMPRARDRETPRLRDRGRDHVSG